MDKRKVLKKLYSVALNLVTTIGDMLKVLIFSKPLKLMNHVEQVESAENCLVLGNGPSIRNSLDEILKKRSTSQVMALNFFCNSEEFFLIKPEYYCICDPVIFNSNKGFDLLPSKMKSFIENLNEIDWICSLYFPSHFNHQYVLNKIENPNVKKIEYNSTTLNGKTKITNWFYRKNLGMPTPESVIIPAIFLSINNQFKRIYIYGVDHTWAKFIEVDENNNSSFLLEHFWGKDDRTKSDRNISSFFKSQHRLFNSHDQLEIYAKSRNIKIINKTNTSLIDSYDRDE